MMKRDATRFRERFALDYYNYFTLPFLLVTTDKKRRSVFLLRKLLGEASLTALWGGKAAEKVATNPSSTHPRFQLR